MHRLTERTEEVRESYFTLSRSRQRKGPIEALASGWPSPLAGPVSDSWSGALRRVLLPDYGRDPLDWAYREASLRPRRSKRIVEVVDDTWLWLVLERGAVCDSFHGRDIIERLGLSTGESKRSQDDVELTRRINRLCRDEPVRSEIVGPTGIPHRQ
jgi:hypothetical protein